MKYYNLVCGNICYKWHKAFSKQFILKKKKKKTQKYRRESERKNGKIKRSKVNEIIIPMMATRSMKGVWCLIWKQHNIFHNLSRVMMTS